MPRMIVSLIQVRSLTWVTVRPAWRRACARPSPMLTTHLPRAGSGRRVVPGVAVGQEPVGFLGAPGAPGVRVDRHYVAQHRVHDPPGGLDGVLAGEQLPLAVESGADQPVVGAHVAAGPLGEGQVVHLRLPPRARL